MISFQQSIIQYKFLLELDFIECPSGEIRYRNTVVEVHRM